MNIINHIIAYNKNIINHIIAYNKNNIYLPCGLEDQNSANVCQCACRKRPLIMGYKLSYTTGLLHAWSSCMQ